MMTNKYCQKFGQLVNKWKNYFITVLINSKFQEYLKYEFLIKVYRMVVSKSILCSY